MERLPKIGLPIILLVIVLIVVVAKSAVVIDSGHAGVLYRSLGDGVVTDKPALGEGFNLVAPWNKVIEFEVRQQSKSYAMDVLSVNGLEIKVDATVWFEPDPASLGKLLQEKGIDYVERILTPAMSAAAREVVGRYTPEQLYSSKRDVIQQEILDETTKGVANQYININKILVKDVTLPPTIKEAIERKLKQEQESLEYEFRLSKAEKEAQRQRIEAEGKAAANRILSASLTDKILTEKGIQATLELAKSPNSKVIVVGGSEGGGLPIILGNQ